MGLGEVSFARGGLADSGQGSAWGVQDTFRGTGVILGTGWGQGSVYAATLDLCGSG